MSIGESIRNLRKKAGFTQKQLAEKVGVNEVTIRSYEAGKYNPKIETIIRISSALGVSPFEIMSVDEYNSLIDSTVSDQIKNDIENGKVHLVSEDEKELTANYLKLNTIGKIEARKRVEELTEIPRYTKPDDSK